jgi:hypothetical protein
MPSQTRTLADVIESRITTVAFEAAFIRRSNTRIRVHSGHKAIHDFTYGMREKTP